jgi:hypothetical protein
MHLDLITPRHSMHSVAAYYRRHAKDAPDAALDASSTGLAAMDFAFHVATTAKPSRYPKYSTNKSCSNSAN